MNKQKKGTHGEVPLQTRDDRRCRMLYIVSNRGQPNCIRVVSTKTDGPIPRRIWQKNYYERIIRNEDELNRIREYINGNPQNWATDEENPANIAADKKQVDIG